MTDTRQDAYLTGREARRNGKTEQDNPYPFDMHTTRLWLAEGWLEGWRDADSMIRSLS